MNDVTVTQADHVLIKRGLYYRPNGNGYTGLKREAGLYDPSYALGFDGVDAVPFADAPDFAPACWEETKLAHLNEQITTARAEAEALRAEVERLREALDAAHYFIDASEQELCDDNWSRGEALDYARTLRQALASEPGK